MFRRFTWSKRSIQQTEVKEETEQEIQLPEENPKAIKPIFKDMKPTS